MTSVGIHRWNRWEFNFLSLMYAFWLWLASLCVNPPSFSNTLPPRGFLSFLSYSKKLRPSKLACVANRTRFSSSSQCAWSCAPSFPLPPTSCCTFSCHWCPLGAQPWLHPVSTETPGKTNSPLSSGVHMQPALGYILTPPLLCQAFQDEVAASWRGHSNQPHPCTVIPQLYGR